MPQHIEKLAPLSYITPPPDSKLQIIYDLSAAKGTEAGGPFSGKYQRISADDGAFLWLDPDRTKKGVPLKNGTQILVKAQAGKLIGSKGTKEKPIKQFHEMLYVIVMTGEHKLDQGYVHILDLAPPPTKTVPVAGKDPKTVYIEPSIPVLAGNAVVAHRAELAHQGGDYLYQGLNGKKGAVDNDAKVLPKLPPSTFLAWHPATKKNKSTKRKYPRVKILNGPLAGYVGHVNRKFIKELEAPAPPGMKKKDKAQWQKSQEAHLQSELARKHAAEVEVNIPIKVALKRLNEKFGGKIIKEMTGEDNVTFTEPAWIPTIYNNLQNDPHPDVQGPATEDSPNLSNKTIAYYNEGHDSIDILQPFYFAPPTIGDEMLKQLQTEFYTDPWACEPLARLIRFTSVELPNVGWIEALGPDATNADVVKWMDAADHLREGHMLGEINPISDIYVATAQNKILLKSLGESMINGEFDYWTYKDLPTDEPQSVATHIAKNAAAFFEMEPSLFENWFSLHHDKTEITYNPQISNTPRWGYFKFKIPLEEFLSAAAGQPILTLAGSNFLTNVQQGTATGTAFVHSYLREFVPFNEATTALSINIEDLDNRIENLGTLAVKHFYTMEKAEEEIFNDKNPHKTVPDQLRTVELFQSFLKTALVTGQVTSEKISQIQKMGMYLHLKSEKSQSTGAQSNSTFTEYQSLSSISLRDHFDDQEGVSSGRVPVINTVDSHGNPETIDLTHGKLCRLEKRFIDQINKEMKKLDFYDLAAEVKKVDDVIKKYSDVELKLPGIYLDHEAAAVEEAAEAKKVADKAKKAAKLASKEDKGKKTAIAKKAQATAATAHAKSKFQPDYSYKRKKSKIESKTLPTLREYVYDHLDTKGYLVFMLADIVRQGIMAREFDEEKIPPNLLQATLVKKAGKKQKQLESITDYTSLSSYVVGAKQLPDKTTELVTYTPDFPHLLKQIRWLNIIEGETNTPSSAKKTMTAKIDYDFLEIGRFSVESGVKLKNLTPAAYSIIMSCKNDDRHAWQMGEDDVVHLGTYDNLTLTQNYKDFFDLLYSHKIEYKKKVTPPKKDSVPPKPKKLFDPLTKEEKDKILSELFSQRNEMVEQGFGGSGCIEFALKSVKTLEDLYTNVIYKGNWALFVAQVVDRFKCELSKLGGGPLECLADFDAIETYKETLQAIETVEHFPRLLKKEMKKQPTSPVMDMILDGSVPTIPTLDWYKCLRPFLISLIYKIIMELIIAFVQMILSLLDVECGADFSKCDKALDEDTSVPSTATGDAVAAGLPHSAAATLDPELAQMLRNSQIDDQITTAKLREFLHFLGENMTVTNFKSLLLEDPPVDIFNHGKFLANNFFAPLKLTKEQFAAMMSLIAKQYSYDALIAARLAEQTLLAPDCPPDLFDNGSSILDSIKDALREKIKKETGMTDAAAEKQAEDDLNKVKEELEEKISAFCKTLHVAEGVLTEVNSAPSLLAGAANDAIAGTVSQLITQLRVKPFYDYRMLRYLFIGDAFSDNPTKDDLVRAEMSLAYNVVYRNYWLTKVDPRSYKKNYELRPEGFRNSIGARWNHVTDLLEADSFERELAQDLLKVLVVIQPYLLPFYPDLEKMLFDVKQKLNGFDITLLGASRDLNNSNYFYAWAENLLSLIPMIDPRRFGTKYPDFVKENYPNASSGKLIEPAFALKTNFDANGLSYVYTNKGSDGAGVTLLDLKIGMTDFEVKINDGKTHFARDLPKLSEPFFVDEAQNYLEIVDTFDKINTATQTDNPQKKIYNSLAEQGLERTGLYSGTGMEYYMGNLVQETFNNSYNRIDAEMKANLDHADEKVAKFFFKPYMEASKRYGGMTDSAAKTFSEGFSSYADILGLLSDFGNPRAPVALFFQRSDNLFSEVFFEDSIDKEVEKIMNKIRASLKNHYNNLTDGELPDPNAISRQLAAGSIDPDAFYEAQKIASSKQHNWLSSRTTSAHWQEAMLEAVKEVAP